MVDNGGRRLGIDRRQYSYTEHIPARRSDDNGRRSGSDRRSGNGFERRNSIDRRLIEYAADIYAKIKERRNENGRRSGMERRAAFAAELVMI